MVATAETTSNQPEQERQFFQKSGKIEPAMISTLQANPWQPRLVIDPSELQALKQSISDFGFIGYVPVRRADESDPLSPLQIVYGHRRVRAAELLGLKTVPVMLCKVSDEAMMRLAYVENATQKKMTYWEEALHFSEMKDTLGLTIRKLADMLGVSRGYVHNRLSLLTLPEDSPLRQAAQDNDIAMSNALAFVNLSKVLEKEQLDQLLEDVRRGHLVIDDLVALQKALDADVPADAEMTDDGARIRTATLIEQTRNKELAQPRFRSVEPPAPSVPPMDRHQEAQWLDAARRAAETESQWNEIERDLPPGPSLEQAGSITLRQMLSPESPAASVSVPAARIEPEPVVERGPLRFESSSFQQRTPRDHALQAIDLLEGFYPHYRKVVERSDFSALTDEEQERFADILIAFRELRRDHYDEVLDVKRSVSGV